MPLINCEIALQLTCCKRSILAAGTGASQVPKFEIPVANLYVRFVTLSTQENIKLLKQLKSDFQRAINWNKYHSKKSNQAQNRYLNVLIDPSFPGVNRHFFLLFEGDDGWKSCKKFYLRTVEIK